MGSVLQHGDWPLYLPRVVADVPITCSRCGAHEVVQLVVGADWWDRAAIVLQRQHADGPRCPRCGSEIELAVPLLQRRSLDAVELLVGLPASSSAESDRRWIRDIVTLMRPYLSSAQVVTVRASWWSSIDTVPLGPVLAGLTSPPEFPEPPGDREQWLESTRAALELPDIVEAVARFVSARTIAEARHVTEQEPDLLDRRWRTTVELAGSRLILLQETAEQREVVEQRLSRLRQIATNGESDIGPADLPDKVQRAIDDAVALHPSDPSRLAALERAIAALRPGGPSRMLAAALTSLLATKLADPRRSPADWAALAGLATEATNVSLAVFGDRHEATVINTMNSLLIQQERPDLTVEDLGVVCAGYEQLAADDDVRRTGHLVDILNNLAAAFDGRSDLSRGERQEVVLQLFEATEHVAKLSLPNDTRTIVLAQVNQASTLRQRISGARLHNAERAWSLLAEAQALEQAQPVLHAVERVQLATNRLNVAFRLFSLGSDQVSAEVLLATARAAVAATGELHDDNETTVVTLLNTGAVLVDIYIGTVRAGHPQPEMLAEAEQLLTPASQRADRLYPPGHRTRLTAALNLAAVYGAATGQGGVLDAERCAELLTRVAEEAKDHSLDHIATAMANLGTLRVGQGRWKDAADAYAAARHARTRMLDQTTVRQTRLGEVIATGDLTAREALAYARLGLADQVIATLEESRARLLRHRHGIGVGAQPPARPGRAVVYLSSCNLGTFGVVQAPGQPARSFVGSLPATAIRDVLYPLVTADTRLAKMLAFAPVEAALGGLVDTVSRLLPDDTGELCVIACGPLAGAPLHAIAGSDSRTWTHRCPVRYWPSGTVVAHRGEPDVRRIHRAVAVTNPTQDLPLAAAELEVVRSFTPDTRTPPDGWSTTAWLRNELSDATLAHFACHARTDLIDPTGSYFELGPDERLSVDDLLDGPDLTQLQLVVASACQAGVPATDALDEILGIGYGLVHAGAVAAITTLWEVNDTPAALLIARLYAELTAGQHPATALQRTQLWLADLDNEQAARLCADRLAHPSGSAAWLPRAIAATLGVQASVADPADHPFRHPTDWGAFTYLGG